MSKRLSPKKQRIAYHEAAHAVAMHLCGWDISYVWMSSQTRRSHLGVAEGQTHYRSPDRATKSDKMFTTLAPHGAERRLCRERGWKIADDWVVSDFSDVLDGYKLRPGRKTISALDRFHIKLMLGKCIEFAEDPANWRAIAVVAEALLDCLRNNESPFLNGDRIHAMIESALKESAA